MEPVLQEPSQQDLPKAFIPPQPERAPNRAPRMPRIDEFPIPAQNEMRAHRGLGWPSLACPNRACPIR
jgi:cell division protein FtsZ